MLAWRVVIVAASLAQIGAGVACWCLAGDPEIGPEIGRFGLAAGVAVGALGLVSQGTTFLRPAAIAANVLLAAVFVPGFLGRVVIRVLVWVNPGAVLPGTYTGVDADLLAAGMLASGAASALGLWRLSAGSSRGRAEQDAAADRPRA
jgi:hypothetical protein